MGNTAYQMEFGPAPRVTVLSKVPHGFIHDPKQRGLSVFNLSNGTTPCSDRKLLSPGT